jgi:hypothetical protein
MQGKYYNVLNRVAPIDVAGPDQQACVVAVPPKRGKATPHTSDDDEDDILQQRIRRFRGALRAQFGQQFVV